MPIRTFTLNSREFYEAVCEPRERPWIPNGALPREPRRPTPSSGVWGMAEQGWFRNRHAESVQRREDHLTDEEQWAAREWLRHVEAGRTRKK